jgi:hypothetical protein
MKNAKCQMMENLGGGSVWSSEIDYLTEPSAGRGPQWGSPAGVVDAPDAGVKLRTQQVAHHPWSFSGC